MLVQGKLYNGPLQLVGFLFRNNSSAEFPYLFFEAALTCAHENATNVQGERSGG